MIVYLCILLKRSLQYLIDRFQKVSYEDKRDENGLLLRYSAEKLSENKAKYFLENIKYQSQYSILCSALPAGYVDLYFLKLIKERILPEYGKLKIKEWYLKNKLLKYSKLNVIRDEQFIELMIFYCVVIRYKLKLKNIYKKLQGKFTTSESNENVEVEGMFGNIAIYPAEGLDPKKRSDIFWYDNSQIDPSKIIIYYDKGRLKSVTIPSHCENSKKFNYQKIEDLNFEKNCPLFESLAEKIKQSKTENIYEYWLKLESYLFIQKVNFWYSFFKENNVFLHLDSSLKEDTICKQIAIRLNKGISIGKLRSYTRGYFSWCYYPDDILFTWGKDSAKKITKTKNYNDNVLISGFPYILNNWSNGSKNGKNFVILILDSNFGENKGLTQIAHLSFMKIFYNFFFQWLIEDEQVFLIIKPKRNYAIPVDEYLLDESLSTKRLEIIDNPFQVSPANFANKSDMVVSTGAFFSSALMECIAFGARGIFYDYPNLRSLEPELYAWGENKVIFSDMDQMMTALKEYKANPANHPSLGDWSEHLDDIDPFRDNRGGERIGTYMRWLLEGFERGLNRQENIHEANRLYAEAWGEDKVYKVSTKNTTANSTTQCK